MGAGYCSNYGDEQHSGAVANPDRVLGGCGRRASCDDSRHLGATCQEDAHYEDGCPRGPRD